MTLEPEPEARPPSRAEPPGTIGERQETFAGLVMTAISSWPTTLRVAVLIAIIAAALWLLPIDLVLGPLQITKH